MNRTVPCSATPRSSQGAHRSKFGGCRTHSKRSLSCTDPALLRDLPGPDTEFCPLPSNRTFWPQGGEAQCVKWTVRPPNTVDLMRPLMAPGIGAWFRSRERLKAQQHPPEELGKQQSRCWVSERSQEPKTVQTLTKFCDKAANIKTLQDESAPNEAQGTAQTMTMD